MKKKLLLLGLVFGFTAISKAQTTMQYANEPAIGDAAIRYIVDSNATNMANATGNGITWDYSGVHGYMATGNDIKILTVVDATSAPNAADFPTATNSLNIPSYMDTYYEYNGTNTERIMDGFVMNVDLMGSPATIVINYDSDPAKSMVFPFAYGDSFNDLVFGTMSGAVTGTLTGKTTVTADGLGTLKLQFVDFTDVLRIHTIDTLYATISGLGNATIIRNQFDYFVSDSLFPLFTHTSTSIASTMINETIGVVLSAVRPTADAGIDEMAKVADFSVFPNPTNDNVAVVIENFDNAKIEVVNMVGQVVKTIEPTSKSTKIDLANQTSGMYFVKVTNGTHQTTKKLIVR